jgi:hypothetical protein
MLISCPPSQGFFPYRAKHQPAITKHKKMLIENVWFDNNYGKKKTKRFFLFYLLRIK